MSNNNRSPDRGRRGQDQSEPVLAQSFRGLALRPGLSREKFRRPVQHFSPPRTAHKDYYNGEFYKYHEQHGGRHKDHYIEKTYLEKPPESYPSKDDKKYFHGDDWLATRKGPDFELSQSSPLYRSNDLNHTTHPLHGTKQWKDEPKYQSPTVSPAATGRPGSALSSTIYGKGRPGSAVSAGAKPFAPPSQNRPGTAKSEISYTSSFNPYNRDPNYLAWKSNLETTRNITKDLWRKELDRQRWLSPSRQKMKGLVSSNMGASAYPYGLFTEAAQIGHGAVANPEHAQKLHHINNLLKEKLWKRNHGGPEALQKAFIQADKDRSGTVSFKEFKVILRRQQIFMDDEDALLLMSRFDKDGDGDISYIEFIQQLSE